MILKHPNRIDFDPSNQNHRNAVRDYMRRNAWSDTKLRFNDNPHFGSVAHMVQEKLLVWYMSQEENRANRSKKVLVNV